MCWSGRGLLLEHGLTLAATAAIIANIKFYVKNNGSNNCLNHPWAPWEKTISKTQTGQTVNKVCMTVYGPTETCHSMQDGLFLMLCCKPAVVYLCVFTLTSLRFPTSRVSLSTRCVTKMTSMTSLKCAALLVKATNCWPTGWALVVLMVIWNRKENVH